MKSSHKPSRKPGHNVVNLVTTTHASIAPASVGARNIKNKPDDVRVKEAMRLAQAFLAIEDPVARAALVALAERLISYDWIRKVK